MKILVLAAVLVAVWALMRPAPRSRPSVRSADPARPPPGAPVGPRIGAEDLARCAVCGTFVPVRQARACGRSNCPNA